MVDSPNPNPTEGKTVSQGLTGCVRGTHPDKSLSTPCVTSVIYNRPLPARIVGDNSETLNLHEHDWLRQHYPDVLLLEDLYAQNQHRVSSFNHLQLLVYANCERFISMHGGTAALASYFGGINVILSYPGSGLEAEFDEYATIFPAVSGATIIHVQSREEVLTQLDKF